MKIIVGRQYKLNEDIKAIWTLNPDDKEVHKPIPAGTLVIVTRYDEPYITIEYNGLKVITEDHMIDEIIDPLTLKDFINRYICKNTVVRLWNKSKEKGYSHKMLISDDGRETCMEWQLLSHKTSLSKYLDNEVIGVADIICETCVEAVNIVIKE